MFAFLSNLHLHAFIFNFCHNVLQDRIPQTFCCRLPLMICLMLCITSSCYTVGYGRCVCLFSFCCCHFDEHDGWYKADCQVALFWGEVFPILCSIKIIHIVIYCYHYMAMTSAVLHHTKCILLHLDFSWTHLSNYFISVGLMEVQLTNTLVFQCSSNRRMFWKKIWGQTT